MTKLRSESCCEFWALVWDNIQREAIQLENKLNSHLGRLCSCEQHEQGDNVDQISRVGNMSGTNRQPVHHPAHHSNTKKHLAHDLSLSSWVRRERILINSEKRQWLIGHPELIFLMYNMRGCPVWAHRKQSVLWAHTEWFLAIYVARVTNENERDYTSSIWVMYVY